MTPSNRRALFVGSLVTLLGAGCSTSPAPDAGDRASVAPLAGQGYRLEPVYVVTVHVPEEDTERVLSRILQADPLRYGRFDQAAFLSASGVEQFRPLAGARAGAQDRPSRVASVRITLSLRRDPSVLREVLAAVREVHPYEEPVVHVVAGYASRALDDVAEETNPNRWWNRGPSPSDPADPAPAGGVRDPRPQAGPKASPAPPAAVPAKKAKPT